MITFEEIINSSTLDVIVPSVVLKFPTRDIDHSPWLEKLRSEGFERERAFFGSQSLSFLSSSLTHLCPFPDEFLDFFFLLNLENLGEAHIDPTHPPFFLLSFLAHTQISYDATYISPASVSVPSAPQLGIPPRTTSLKPGVDKGGLYVPPRIFPVNTPNPTPVTTEQDRRYVRTEGVTLASGVWGEEPDPVKDEQVEASDSFALLWDKTSGVWVAVYRMCVNVGALR
jgi:hypothetical protein